MFHVPEKYRVRYGLFTSSQKDGNNGAFSIGIGGLMFNIMASDQLGWEHVSVSIDKPRCPSWDEMCRIKELFWDDTDTVLQYHPSKDQYVNNHPFVLHLWRPTDQAIPVPPKEFV